MGFKYTYTKEQYEEVMSLAEVGFTMKLISRQTEIPYDTVRGWVNRGNKPLHAWTAEDWLHKKGNSQETRDEWTEEKREEFIEKCREPKMGEKNPMWLGEDITGERRPYIKRGEYKGKIGENNPMWKGDDVSNVDTARARVRRKYKSVITLLNELSGGKWEIHHIDENPLNNEDDNLSISTRKGHMTIDGRLEEVTRTFKENNPGTNSRRGGDRAC